MTEDGIYIVKAGETYKITPKIEIPFAKRVNIMTGEIYYPSNADRIRQMTDEELADMFWEFLTDSQFKNPYREKAELLDWLKATVEVSE